MYFFYKMFMIIWFIVHVIKIYIFITYVRTYICRYDILFYFILLSVLHFCMKLTFNKSRVIKRLTVDYIINIITTYNIS